MKTFTYAAAIALAIGFTPLAASAQEAENAAVNGEQNAFGVWDENQDGVLEEEEYASAGENFGTYDEDDSGFIEEDEYNTWANDTFGEGYDDQQTAALNDEWDDNEDGQLAENEFGSDDEFLEWDENESGALEEDEGWF